MQCAIVSSDPHLIEPLRSRLEELGHTIFNLYGDISHVRAFLHENETDVAEFLWVIDSHIGTPLPFDPDGKADLSDDSPAKTICMEIEEYHPDVPYILGMTRPGCMNDSLMFDGVSVYSFSLIISNWPMLLENHIVKVRELREARLTLT